LKLKKISKLCEKKCKLSAMGYRPGRRKNSKILPLIMKKVLIIQYSQSGQLSRVLENLAAPLKRHDGISVTVETLRPKVPFPFPWPIFRFFDTFPDCVYLDPPEMEPLALDQGERFDLVILGYQAWFLSPSLPATAFLKSQAGKAILNNCPVVTVVACRDMWLMAQEQIKAMLSAASARLVGHVALVDEAGSIGSFLATPLWVLSGNPGPRLGGLIPRAGVKAEQIAASSRFGEKMAQVLNGGGPLDESLLQNMQAAYVNPGLISSEKAIRRGFLIWGKLLRALGPRGAWQRKPVLLLYMAWLVLAIITLVPLGLLLKKLLAPLLKKKVEEQRRYYGAPSGY
jgi:hypothetical protein